MPVDEVVELEALARGVLAGKRRSLAKAITLVESQRPDHEVAAEQLVSRITSAAGKAHRVGVSGVPGAGKSTFIEALGLMLVGRGHRIAVLTVDPSSRVSGGSILGDKTRMARLAREEACFIRPSPSAGTLGGVARRTREVIMLCEAAGYDVVIVETMGVGQSEHAVYGLVDVFLLLALAGAGDELQGIKRGILELVDIVCINKADGDALPRAQRAAAEMTSALRLLRGHACPPVLLTSGMEGTGVEEAWKELHSQRVAAEQSGALADRRGRQNVEWMEVLIREGLERALKEHPLAGQLRDQLVAGVRGGGVSPSRAAQVVLEAFRGPPP